jgi:DNA-binding LytR/AlgR family response regulator
MISCIAIDDEPLALDLVSNYCSRLEYLDLKKIFTRTTEASNFLKNFPVDLLLLDIRMPDMSGIEFYKLYGEQRMVIFTTAYSDYGVEGFNLNAIDYLLKPISFERFERAARKARDYYDYINNSNSIKDKYLFVRSEYKLVKILLNDILYVEGLDDYVKIFTHEKKPVISHMSLKSINERLSEDMFIRVHRSYIINFRNAQSYCCRKIQLGNVYVPVGLSYEKEIRKIFRSQL